jgi:hypothetical protein
MPRSAAAVNPGRLTPDRARELAQRRWQRDNQGLDDCIDRLEKRSDALTGEQVRRLEEIAWAQRAAAALPAFGKSEIDAAARAAAAIDARIARKAGADRAAT